MSGPPTVTNDAAGRAPRRRAPLAREQPARVPRVAGARRRPRRAGRAPHRRRGARGHPRRDAASHHGPARPRAHAHGRRASARAAARPGPTADGRARADARGRPRDRGRGRRRRARGSQGAGPEPRRPLLSALPDQAGRAIPGTRGAGHRRAVEREAPRARQPHVVQPGGHRARPDAGPQAEHDAARVRDARPAGPRPAGRHGGVGAPVRRHRRRAQVHARRRARDGGRAGGPGEGRRVDRQRRAGDAPGDRSRRGRADQRSSGPRAARARAGVIRRVAIAGVLLALASSASAGPGPLIAAHRGGARLWPENSLAAFRGAIALGVDALEFDVHLTASGEPVVILDPTTTARGLVLEATRDALSTARLRDATGAPTDERVPTLAQVLDLAASSKVEVLPEIKPRVNGAPYDGLEVLVLEALAARGLSPRAVVQSFDPATLARVRARTPSARTMLLVSRTRLGVEGISAVDAVRRAAGVGTTDVGIDHHLVDARVVAAARAARVRLSAWTVNAEADLLRVRTLGVDVVMTDRPDLALRLFGRR